MLEQYAFNVPDSVMWGELRPLRDLADSIGDVASDVSSPGLLFIPVGRSSIFQTPMLADAVGVVTTRSVPDRHRKA
jgi:hypothetical protein